MGDCVKDEYVMGDCVKDEYVMGDCVKDECVKDECVMGDCVKDECVMGDCVKDECVMGEAHVYSGRAWFVAYEVAFEQTVSAVTQSWLHDVPTTQHEAVQTQLCAHTVSSILTSIVTSNLISRSNLLGFSTQKFTHCSEVEIPHFSKHVLFRGEHEADRTFQWRTSLRVTLKFL